MVLEPHDLHWLFSRDARTCRAYDAKGALVFSCEARNRTTNDLAPPSERFGPCPAGNFVFGPPVYKFSAPFGPWFVLMSGPAMNANGRAGIGWHGGGSGLPHPMDPGQGWRPTHGCWRSQNQDLKRGVLLIIAAQHAGGICYVTVAPFAAAGPASEQIVWDDAPDQPLDPSE